MKCPKCSREIREEGQMYCLYCGAPLTGNKKEKKKKRKLALPVGIACGCAAVLVAGFFLAAQETQAGKLEKKLAEGNKYLASADYEKAEVAFSEALSIDETSPDAALGLAKVSNEKEEPEKALEYLTKASDNLEKKRVSEIRKGKADWKEKSVEYQEVFNTTIQLLNVSSNTEVVQQAVQMQEQVENTFEIIDAVVAEDDTEEYNEMDLEEYENEVLKVTGDSDFEETSSAASETEPAPETEPASEIASDTQTIVIYDDGSVGMDITEKTMDGETSEQTDAQAETSEQPAAEEEITKEETAGQQTTEESGQLDVEAVAGAESEVSEQPAEEADAQPTTTAVMEILSESGTEVSSDEAADTSTEETVSPESTDTEMTVQTETVSETETQTETEALEAALTVDELLDNYAAQTILPAAPYFGGSEISYDYAAGSGSLASISGTLGLEKADLDGDGVPELAVISADQGKLNVTVYRVAEQSVETAASVSAVCDGLGNALEGLSCETVQECFIRDNGGSYDIGFASHCVNISGGDGNPAVQTSVELYRYADGTLSLINAATIRNGTSVYTGGNEETAVDGGKEEFMVQLSAMGLSGSWISESADTCASLDLVNNPWQDLSAVPNPLSGGLSAVETGIQDLAVLTGTMGAEGQTISFSVQNNTNLQN